MVRACLLILVAIVAAVTAAQHPALTVTDLDRPGGGEAIRLALYIAEIPFHDDRIQSADWCNLKPKTPFGQLPTLSVDGEVYSHSRAILRYVGKRGGLYPSDGRQALSVDMILDKIEDMMLTFRPVGSETDKDKKKSMIKCLVQDILPAHIRQLEQVICKSSPHYSVGDHLTIADVLISYYVTEILHVADTEQVPFDRRPYKNVNNVYRTVKNHPRVQDFYQKRASNSQSQPG